MKLFDVYFLTYLVLLIFIKTCRFYEIDLGIFNSYLTDLIAVPTMAHLGSFITSKLIFKNSLYTYPFLYLIITATVLSILMEIIMPIYSTNYTGDWMDIVCYFVGIFIYQLFHKPYIIRQYPTP